MGILGSMRDNSKSRWIKLLLYAVALSFVIGFGAMGYLGKTAKGQAQGEWVLKVNHHVVYRSEFGRAVQNYRQSIRSQYGDRADEELKKQNVEKIVLQRLIRDNLLADEAAEKGFTVSDAELQGAIKKAGWFNTDDGVFDKQKYLTLLRRNNMAPQEFEAQMRVDIASQKLQTFVISSAKVSENEIWNLYEKNYDKAALKFMRFTAKNLQENPVVTEQQVADYFESHKETFKVPEMRKIQYIVLDVADFGDAVKITDDEVYKYYEKNRETLYKVEQQVKASHILIKSSQNDPPSVREALRKLAVEVQKQAIVDGADFAALAKQYSQDDSNKDKGGELGWFGRGAMLPQFSVAAFSMDVGEVSDVVETMYGYHIIKVEDTRPDGYKTLEEVTDSIKVALGAAKAMQSAQIVAERIYGDLKPSTDLAEYGKAEELKFGTSSPFVQTSQIPGIENSTRIAAEAFKLNKDEIAEPIKGYSKVYIVKLVNIDLAHDAVFDEIEGKVRAAAQQDAMSRRLALVAEQARTDLVKTSDGNAVAAQFGVKVETTGLFSRGARSIPKLGPNSGLQQAAFSLTLDNPVPDKVYGVGNAQVVVWLEQRVAASKEDFEKQKQMMKFTLLRQQQQLLLDAFLKDATQRGKVVKNKRFTDKFENKPEAQNMQFMM